MIAASPLLGMGAGNYPAVYEWFAVRGWNEALGHAHNFYLNIAAETGLVGVAVYLSIFIVALLHTVKALLQGARASCPPRVVGQGINPCRPAVVGEVVGDGQRRASMSPGRKGTSPFPTGRGGGPVGGRHSQAIWRGILLGVLGSLVAVCVHNMFDSLFVHGMSIQLGMILALGQLSATALSQPLLRSQSSL